MATRARDGRLIARHNELDCLYALHRLGYATSADLAHLIWPARPQGRTMAQRTLRRLLAQREVIVGRRADSVPVYGLARRGAQRLRGERGVDARSAKDALRQAGMRTALHRALSNELLITLKRDHGLAWEQLVSERDLAAGRVRLDRARVTKIPDGMVLVPDPDYPAEPDVVWCEVERTYKRARDHGRLVQWLLSLGGDSKVPLGRGLWLDRIVVLGQTPHFRRLLRALRRSDDPRAARVAEDPNAVFLAQRRAPYTIAITPLAHWAQQQDDGA